MDLRYLFLQNIFFCEFVPGSRCIGVCVSVWFLSCESWCLLTVIYKTLIPNTSVIQPSSPISKSPPRYSTLSSFSKNIPTPGLGPI